MRQFDLKEHREKVKEMSRRAVAGTYPSPKVARIGSSVGLVIGAGLLLAGLLGAFSGGALWWGGSLFAGATTVGSNVFNLGRLRKLEQQDIV